MPILAHTVFGASDPDSPTVFLIHGILGSRRNWASSARRIVGRYPHWRVVSIDLRGHGDSHGHHGPHTVEACARDLVDLAKHLDVHPDVSLAIRLGARSHWPMGARVPQAFKRLSLIPTRG